MSQTTKTKPAGYSLTDPSTWVSLLSVAWAVLSVVHPGFHLQAYIAPASIAAAAIVVAIIAFAKHHLSILRGLEDVVSAVEHGFASHAAPPAPTPTKSSVSKRAT